MAAVSLLGWRDAAHAKKAGTVFTRVRVRVMG
jgi:hypothetical protein